MSSVLFDRLLLKFIDVKRRLETLLNVCRLHVNENSSWKNDDLIDDFNRFYGPDHADIEELETSIATISKLIEDFDHEQSANRYCEPFPNYPLCGNNWTWKKIKQLEKPEFLTLDIVHKIALHTIHALDNDINRIDSTTQHSNVGNENFLKLDPLNALPVSSSVELNKSTKNTKSDLLELPTELLFQLFSYLSPFELMTKLAPTCRFMANSILSSSYSHLDLSKILSVFEITHLLTHLTHLRSVTFIDWENEVSILTWAIWFDRISLATSNLHTMRFQNVSINPILICLIVEYFPHCLKTIIFDYQQHKAYEKYDLILSLLADENTHLQRITASYQTGITNFGILQLINNLNTIVELNLLYVEAINDPTVKALCNKHKEHLEILKIDGAQLSDTAIEYIDYCRKLTSVMIEFCTNMIGIHFRIFHNFDQLKELCLSKLTAVPLISFKQLFDGKHIFEHLILLRLGECHLIDDDCVQAIIKMCPRLIDFTCSWAYSLTDDSFNEIVIRCCHLRRLSLVGCHQIYGHILNLVPEKHFRDIEYLNFEQCNQIEDELLVNLHKRKKSISIVNYYGTSVDDDDDDEGNC